MIPLLAVGILAYVAVGIGIARRIAARDTIEWQDTPDDNAVLGLIALLWPLAAVVIALAVAGRLIRNDR